MAVVEGTKQVALRYRRTNTINEYFLSGRRKGNNKIVYVLVVYSHTKEKLDNYDVIFTTLSFSCSYH